MKIKITNKNIADFLNADLHGDIHEIVSLSSFPNKANNSISFLQKIKVQIGKIKKESTIIASKSHHKYLEKFGCSIIFSDNPKYDFARICYQFLKKIIYKIHENTIIGKNVKLDKQIKIAANVVLGDNVEIKKGVIIESNVVIKENVKIEENVVIRSGTVIGGRAFNFGLIDKF